MDAKNVYRSNNPANDCGIVCSKRTHENRSNRLYPEERSDSDWVELVLPLGLKKTEVYYSSPWQERLFGKTKKQKGEVLNDLRFGEKQVNELKKVTRLLWICRAMSAKTFTNRWQDNQKKWFKLWGSPIKPKFDYILQSWDTAISDEPTTAYSACTMGEYGVKNPRMSFSR